jgi:hypothetical protein
MAHRDELWVDVMNNSWPKIVHAVEVENRLGDEISVTLQTFAHEGKGVVLKLVVQRKSDPVGVILPNSVRLN